MEPLPTEDMSIEAFKTVEPIQAPQMVESQEFPIEAPRMVESQEFPIEAMEAHVVPLQPPLIKASQIIPPLEESHNPPTQPSQPSNDVSDCLMFKNRLQQYAFKTSSELPAYRTINEGTQHEPKFRSTVFIDGISYTSENTFAQRKSAEQDAARVALENIFQKVKDEAYAVVREDTTFCKAILNEYAVKMHLGMPAYQTIQKPGLIPVFESIVELKGVNYRGDKGRNKKEAEQLAARVVIMFILDHGSSESVNVLCGIVTSKLKLYAAINKSKDNVNICSARISIVSSQEDPFDQSHKGKETDVASSFVGLLGVNESSSDILTKMQATPSIEFEPSGTNQDVAQTSGANRKRKPKPKKKKAKKRLQVGLEMSVPIVPLTEITPSVAQ